MVIRDVTLGEKLVFGGLLPRVRVPLWFNRLDRNVVLLGPLSFIGTDSGVISYRDVCNNEGVAPGYGPYTPAPAVKTSNSAKMNQSGAKQTLMREQIFTAQAPARLTGDLLAWIASPTLHDLKPAESASESGCHHQARSFAAGATGILLETGDR